MKQNTLENEFKPYLALNQAKNEKSKIKVFNIKNDKEIKIPKKTKKETINGNSITKNEEIFAKNIKISQNVDLLQTYLEIKESKLLGKKRTLGFNKDLKDADFVRTGITSFVKKNDNETKGNVINFNKINFKTDKIFDDTLNLKTVIKNIYSNKKIIEKLNIFNKKTNNQESNADSIANPYDNYLRNEYADNLDFIKQFKEDYLPIQMQKENEKILEKLTESKKDRDDISISSFKAVSEKGSTAGNSSVSKTHFIKKKQSAVNIKRQCGVSYIVPTESKQLDVENRYKQLGHLVYQGTHSVNVSNDEAVLKFIENIIQTELMNKPLLVTIFESSDEEEMKEYLLFPNKRLGIAKEVFVVESLDEIWKFAKDRHFLAINLIYDNDNGVRNYTENEINNFDIKSLLEISNVHIGFLFRKALSGIKSILKLYKNNFNSIQHSSTTKICYLNDDNLDSAIERLSGSNMNTMSMRIELYFPEKSWKKSDIFTQEFLYSFMCLVEEKISKLILNWNEYRHTMFLLNKDMKVKEFIQNFPYYTLKENLNPSDNKNLMNELSNLSKEKLQESHTDTEENETYKRLVLEKRNHSNSYAEKLNLINNLCFSNIPLPMYIISTRDCFVFDLDVKTEELNIKEGVKILKKEYFFNPNNIPSNFYKFKEYPDDYRVGVVTYEGYFSNEVLKDIENCVEKTEELSLKDAFLPETAQKTFSGEKIKRTKFFFGARYMWTKKQLSEPNSYVAAGIRTDVSGAPYWMKEKIEFPLAKDKIIREDFVNSFAMNVYHDGSEGLGQHFDDAIRFKQVY